MSTPRTLAVPPGTAARRFTVRGARLAAFDTPAAGAAAARPTVLLVPGFTGSKEDFLPVLAPIAAAGHRVVAVDLRGQHESASEDHDDPARHGVTELGADVLALVDAVGDGPAHLVGHSFGGLVCRAATIADPARVRSLVLLDTGPAAVSDGVRDQARLFRDVLAEHGPEAVWHGMRALDEAAGIPPVADPEIAAFLERRFFANSPASLMAMAEALTVEPDRLDELKATGVPLLVVHGEAEDRWPPPVQAEMAQRLHVRRVVIEDAAHSPAVENPQRTVETLLEFWRAL